MNIRSARSLILAAAAFAASPAFGDIATTPTMDGATLAAALHPTGLTITSIVVKNGVDGQFGTYSNFINGPVTIHDGIVLSSGNVSVLGPLPEAQLPDYQPSSPPPAVNSQMVMTDPETSGGTPEFDDYGSLSNNIENFQGSYDVAAIEVHFTLADTYQVKFDFIFGSVEFPFYTSSFTDAFLVFLDGTAPSDQITFDASGSAVQVGVSFAGLETTTDVNTAFSSPHGLIHHLTTTTAELERGDHVLTFEVGDVNDHILDSVAFIANLRTGAGGIGTVPTEDCRADFNSDDQVSVQDIYDFLFDWNTQVVGGEEVIDSADFNQSGAVTVQDIYDFLAEWNTPCHHG